jgi:predicted DNA-binding antitoxin AbrB/MazE fold protein
MAITVEAIYENGVLKLSEPLPWKDGEKVSIDVSSLDSPILKAYGIMGWKGTSEELDRLLAEIEFDEDEVP